MGRISSNQRKKLQRIGRSNSERRKESPEELYATSKWTISTLWTKSQVFNGKRRNRKKRAKKLLWRIYKLLLLPLFLRRRKRLKKRRQRVLVRLLASPQPRRKEAGR